MSLYHKKNNGIKKQLATLEKSRVANYSELTYEKLQAIIDDVMCGPVPEGRQLKVWAITPDGLVPIEQTPEFDRAMKEEYKRMIDEGEI